MWVLGTEPEPSERAATAELRLQPLNFILHLLFILCWDMHHGKHAEFREQLGSVSSRHSSCVFRGLNQGHQIPWQMLLLYSLSHLTSSKIGIL